MRKITKLFLITAAIVAWGTTVTATPIVAPATSAPTPTVASSKVISIFSDAYTSVTGTDFFPNWGQVTTYTPTLVGASDNEIGRAHV